MRDDGYLASVSAAPTGGADPYNVVIVTMDQHSAGPAARIAPALQKAFPGITVTIHAAAEWAENPSSLAATKTAVANADMIIANMLFIEEHVNAILPDLTAARARVDAMVCLIADAQVTKLTKMGDLDITKPASPLMALLKKLKPKKGTSATSGERQMSMLRRIPKILRFIPGKSQDLRAWFLSMQYWLGGSDDNMEQMLRYLVGRYAARAEWRGVTSVAPIDYAEVALYHPDLPARITTNLADLPRPVDAKVTVGLLTLRS